jgi:hypothetical protein
MNVRVFIPGASCLCYAMSASTPTSTPTSAFASPQQPPRPVIVLLAHTDLVNRFRRVPLLAHEDLVSRVRLLAPARHHPYTRQQTSPLSSSQESSEDEDESSSGTSSHPIRRPGSLTPALGPALEQSQQSHRIRIVRPKGAGRQSLRDLLKWDGQRLDAVKKRLRHYVEEYLKKSECFTDQDQDQVKRVKEQVAHLHF